MKKKRKLYKLYLKLYWIVEYLSNRVYSIDKIGFTKDDLVQELSIKLWITLDRYLQLVKEGRKPRVNIKKYVHLSLKRFAIDLIRKINRRISTVPLDKIVSNNNIGYFEKSNVEINLDSREIIIDGVKFQYDIDEFEQYNIFFDYLIGYSYKEISFFYNKEQKEIFKIISYFKKKIKKQALLNKE